jgi:hypothetical protein
VHVEELDESLKTVDAAFENFGQRFLEGRWLLAGEGLELSLRSWRRSYHHVVENEFDEPDERKDQAPEGERPQMVGHPAPERTRDRPHWVFLLFEVPHRARGSDDELIHGNQEGHIPEESEEMRDQDLADMMLLVPVDAGEDRKVFILLDFPRAVKVQRDHDPVSNESRHHQEKKRRNAEGLRHRLHELGGCLQDRDRDSDRLVDAAEDAEGDEEDPGERVGAVAADFLGLLEVLVDFPVGGVFVLFLPGS